MSPFDLRRIEINRTAAAQARETAAAWLAGQDDFDAQWREQSVAAARAAHERALWYESTIRMIEDSYRVRDTAA